MDNNLLLIKQALEDNTLTDNPSVTKLVEGSKAGKIYGLATNVGKPALDAGASMAKKLYGSIKGFATKEQKESTRGLDEVTKALAVTSPTTTSEVALTKSASPVIQGALHGAAASAIQKYEENKESKKGMLGLKKYISKKPVTSGVGKAAIDGALNSPGVRGAVQRYLPQHGVVNR